MSSPAHVNFEIEAVTPGRRSGFMHWEILNPLPGIPCSSELFGIGLGGAPPCDGPFLHECNSMTEG